MLNPTILINEAKRRGINIDIIDPGMPILVLKHAGKKIRCYNALTDKVGAVSFQLAKDKHLANQFLARYGFPVPRQIKYSRLDQARAFLQRHKSIVIKPCRAAGGRGVATAVKTMADLQRAIKHANKIGEDIILEEFIEGLDYRLIIIDGKFACAIQREPASVIGNGKNSIRKLIKQRNARIRKTDPGNIIPLDADTRRYLRVGGLDYDIVPRRGKKVQVQQSSNYHTGGIIKDITDMVSEELVQEAQKVARVFDIPVLGIDFLVHPRTRKHWIIEVTPDLAVSPPEGERVTRYLLDFLFPEIRWTPPRM